MLYESHTFAQTNPAQFRDNFEASSPLGLIEIGWTFTAEPTIDSRWRVVGSKGDQQIAATAARLGEAFLQVEMEVRESEAASGLSF